MKGVDMTRVNLQIPKEKRLSKRKLKKINKFFHSCKIILALFSVTLALPAPALDIPLDISILGRKDNSYYPPNDKVQAINMGRNCFEYFNNLYKTEKEGYYNTQWALWAPGLLLGIGPIFGLTEIILKNMHISYPKLYRAEKLKHLLIAVADRDEYVNSNTGDVVSFKKIDKKCREQNYLKVQEDFERFYNKLSKDQEYKLEKQNEPASDGWRQLSSDSNDNSSLSKEERKTLSREYIKDLLKRASRTGVLCSNDLTKVIFETRSFAPLRTVIISGQLEEKVSEMERILKERDTAIAALEDNISQNILSTINKEVLNSVEKSESSKSSESSESNMKRLPPMMSTSSVFTNSLAVTKSSTNASSSAVSSSASVSNSSSTSNSAYISKIPFLLEKKAKDHNKKKYKIIYNIIKAKITSIPVYKF